MEREPSLKHSSLPLTRCSCAGFAVHGIFDSPGQVDVDVVGYRQVFAGWWLMSLSTASQGQTGVILWETWECGTLEIKCPQRLLTWELIKHPPLCLSVPTAGQSFMQSCSFTQRNYLGVGEIYIFRWVCNPGRHGRNQYPLNGSQRCLAKVFWRGMWFGSRKW